MSIRSATVTICVCAGVCAHAGPVFTAGDVFSISNEPMYEVAGGRSFSASAPHPLFPTGWQTQGRIETTSVMKIDLVTGHRSDHGWGQCCRALPVANAKFLPGSYNEPASSIWEISNGGICESIAAWATGPPGYSDVVLATVPCTPPPPPPPDLDPHSHRDTDTELPAAETSGPSVLLLAATGALMVGARAFRR